MFTYLVKFTNPNNYYFIFFLKKEGKGVSEFFHENSQIFLLDANH